jgi:hypothetical protein
MDVSSIIIQEFKLICGSMVKIFSLALCITDDIPILFQYNEIQRKENPFTSLQEP